MTVQAELQVWLVVKMCGGVEFFFYIMVEVWSS